MPDERSIDFKLSDFGAKMATKRPEKLGLLHQIKDATRMGTEGT